MLSVPRTYERLYAQLLSPLEAHPLYRGSLSLFKKHSKNIVTRKMSGQALNLATYMMDRLLEKSIYKRVRDYLGGKMRLMICGGAALPPEVSSFFIVCGLNLIEGYGLTETTGPCFTNTPFDFRIGSVGKFHGQFRGPYSSRVQGSPPLFRLSPVSEMAAVKDETSGESFTPGQIEISGPKLALGYWRKGKLYPLRSPDGFFITSDLGYLKDGYLHLVGRRDNLIKLTSGKFLSIEKLEKKLSGLAGIQACFVFGEGKTYPVVLFFTPGPIKTFDWSSFRESLSKLNSELGTHESIRKYRVLEMRSLLEAMGPNWEQSKIGRRQVYEKFRDLIEDL
jgi:long-chain acyl-CoA synthetase